VVQRNVRLLRLGDAPQLNPHSVSWQPDPVRLIPPSFVLLVLLGCRSGYGHIRLLWEDATYFGIAYEPWYPELPAPLVPDTVLRQARLWASRGADPRCNRYFQADSMYLALSVVSCAERGGFEVQDGRGLAAWSLAGAFLGESPYGLSYHHRDIEPGGRLPNGQTYPWWRGLLAGLRGLAAS
jgi:hypothetical protein